MLLTYSCTPRVKQQNKILINDHLLSEKLDFYRLNLPKYMFSDRINIWRFSRFFGPESLISIPTDTVNICFDYVELDIDFDSSKFNKGNFYSRTSNIFIRKLQLKEAIIKTRSIKDAKFDSKPNDYNRNYLIFLWSKEGELMNGGILKKNHQEELNLQIETQLSKLSAIESINYKIFKGGEFFPDSTHLSEFISQKSIFLIHPDELIWFPKTKTKWLNAD